MWYTKSMKYFLAFLLGVVCAVWLSPPTPTVELDALERERIIYEVLDRLEEDGYNITKAKRSLASKSWGWW